MALCFRLKLPVEADAEKGEGLACVLNGWLVCRATRGRVRLLIYRFLSHFLSLFFSSLITGLRDYNVFDETRTFLLLAVRTRHPYITLHSFETAGLDSAFPSRPAITFLISHCDALHDRHSLHDVEEICTWTRRANTPLTHFTASKT